MAADDVNRVHLQAMAYMWGRQDAGPDYQGSSVDFANYYLATRQREHATLQAAYAKWVADARPVIDVNWANLTIV